VGPDFLGWAADVYLAVRPGGGAFQPARRCIQTQHMVDRRFDRRRCDAAKATEGSIQVCQQIDLDSLTGVLPAVVDQTM
jgi:hypothetical protein